MSPLPPLGRLCELSYVEMADLFIERSEAASLISSVATPEQRLKSSQLSKGQAFSQADQHSTPLQMDHSSITASAAGNSRPGSRKQQKDRHVDTVIAWCSLRAALLSQQACQQLNATALEMGRQDLSKALNDKALFSLPDGFLLELVHGDHSYPATRTTTPLSLHVLSPSSQTLKAVSITWRQIFTLLNDMRQRMAPSNLSSILAHYSPPLVYHSEAECQSLHKALSEHCANIYDACHTPLLPRLITEHFTKMCTKHGVDLPLLPLPTPSQQQVERWFSAGESQVIQHCYKPAACSGRRDEEEGTRVLIAVNAKLIKHLSSFTMASTSGINVLKVSGGKERLCRMKESLESCASKVKEVSEAAEKGSKARRTSTAMRTVNPPDLQVSSTCIGRIVNIINGFVCVRVCSSLLNVHAVHVHVCAFTKDPTMEYTNAIVLFISSLPMHSLGQPVTSQTLEELYVLCNRQPSEVISQHCVRHCFILAALYMYCVVWYVSMCIYS